MTWVRPLLWASAAIVLELAALMHHRPVLVFNATASAPLGLYLVREPAAVKRGDLVFVWTPEIVRVLAAERGYVPSSVPLVKRVAALAGQSVCARERQVTIDGLWVAEQRQADGKGRPLPRWSGCRTLVGDETFLLMADVPDSFDSRYFGPVSGGTLIGRLLPLWPH